MVTLRLNEEKSLCVPGEGIAGVVGWDLPRPPKSAIVRLFWYTEGRGDQDVTIIEEIELPHADAAYAQPFQFRMPAAPYSFAGALISLKWAIELILDKGGDVQRIELILSPWTEMLTLTSIEMKG